MSDEAKRKRIIRLPYASPCHDQPCKRIPYSDSKALFEMLKNEAIEG